MAWGKKESWFKVDTVGDDHSRMDELEEGTWAADPNQESLEESESVRRIKEEWTRLQVEADSLQSRLVQDAGEVRGGREGVDSGSDDTGLVGQVEWHQVRTLPRSRMPSLDAMKGSTSTFPSINARSSLRKNILEGRSGEHPLDLKVEREAPQKVRLSQTAFCFGSHTPTQTDIRWTPPANAHLFTLLLYDIQVDGGQGWTALTQSRLPILRVYFTSEKIIMGRFSRAQEAEPVSVRVRVRALEKMVRQAEEVMLPGPWSDEVWLTLEGSQVTCNTAI
ncbi:uncharacterized protein LOC143285569 isoform X2 [Babylonia areolata]|uniref:uncharacterized protein LOC143285569 isoform X2 n=1 Tax=Babylonia areolata TaxID=304850 RepID=UPI003FD4C7B9